MTPPFLFVLAKKKPCRNSFFVCKKNGKFANSFGFALSSMTMKRYFWLLLAFSASTVYGQPRHLNLDSCRVLALQCNTNLKISSEKLAESDALRKTAAAQFYPKATFNGAWFWNQKNIELLSNEQKDRLAHLGSGAVGNISLDYPSWIPASLQTSITNLLQSRIGQPVDVIGSHVVESLEFDLSNVWAGAATIYQPIYMGGKLRALYQAAQAADELNGLRHDKAKDDLLLSVDEAYWRVVSVQQKLALAQQYAALLDTLHHNVELMVEAEVATQADLAKVRVKHNEARMSLTKAQSGLALSQMALLQLCGLDFEGDYLFDEPAALTSRDALDSIDMTAVFDRRSELRQLDVADRIALSGVRAARSMLLPNVVAQASYIVSNPNLFNGVQNEFGGMFSVGAAVNIPIAHPGAIYATRAAKHRRAQVQYQMQEAREMITLQVNKLNYELRVANAKLSQATSNMDEADENLRLAQDSFAAGLISSSDLLQAQTAWQQAGSELLDARIEVQMDYLYLRQALGFSNNE